jgi:transmembrane sensor
MDSERIMDEAAAWHVAQSRDDCDWDAFAHWLGADPEHRHAYDEMALLDDAVARHSAALRELLPSAVPAETAPPPSRVRPLWVGGSLAAALALTVGVWTLVPQAEQATDYRTGVGQTRTIALADGSSVLLASASHLRVAGTGQDRMTIEGGAYFNIRHDPGRSLTIRAGDQQISDVGTRFDVFVQNNRARIAVADGRIAISSPQLGERVELAQGKQLVVDGARDFAEVSTIQTRDVGAWRGGRLVYNNVPLSLVASEISRYANRPVTMAPDVASRRFSGVLVIGDGSALVDELAQIMDLQILHKGGTVWLSARKP